MLNEVEQIHHRIKRNEEGKNDDGYLSLFETLYSCIRKEPLM